MKPAMELLKKWKASLGCLTYLIWIRCNAHVEPALGTALSKVLIEMEDLLGVCLKVTL